MRPLYSWILPINDEAEALPQLISEIAVVMRDKPYEIIAINDASTDETARTLTSFALKVIRFTTHQGKWAALATGLKNARGKFIITLDSDLQDDPREVGKLLKKLEDGYDLISGWRRKRMDPLYKALISQLGNRLVSLLYRKHFNDLNAPFKVYRREILDDLPKEGSFLRFSLLFANRLGYKTVEVPISHRRRRFGKSKFGIVKYLRILYDLTLIVLLFSGSGRLGKVRK